MVIGDGACLTLCRPDLPLCSIKSPDVSHNKTLKIANWVKGLYGDLDKSYISDRNMEI